MTAAATEELGNPEEGKAAPGRVVLGILMAALAPALCLVLLGLVMLLAGLPDFIKDFDPVPDADWAALARTGATTAVSSVFMLVLVTGVVSVPAVLVFGLPVILWFRTKDWRDWLRHAAAGAVIGGLAGWLLFGLLPYQSDPLALPAIVLIFAAIGLLSASAYWLVVYGRLRALWMILSLGGVGIVTVSGLAFLVFRAETIGRMGG